MDILTRLRSIRVLQQRSDFHRDGAKSISNNANVHGGPLNDVLRMDLKSGGSPPKG